MKTVIYTCGVGEEYQTRFLKNKVMTKDKNV